VAVGGGGGCGCRHWRRAARGLAADEVRVRVRASGFGASGFGAAVSRAGDLRKGVGGRRRREARRWTWVAGRGGRRGARRRPGSAA
jgi:hypothetical protein